MGIEMTDGTKTEDLAFSKLCSLERELRKAGGDALTDNEYHSARRAILSFLADLGSVDSHGLSLPDIIDEASRFPNRPSIRTAALLITRIASRDRLLPEHTTANRLKLKVVHLFEVGLPDLANKIGLQPTQQTFEKYDKICQLHAEMCHRVEVLRTYTKLESSVDLLVAGRQQVQKAIGNELVAAYFGMFGQKRMQSTLLNILGKLEHLVNIADASFASELQSLKQQVDEEQKWADRSPTCLVTDYYSPYLSAMASALVRLEDDAKDRFACNLTPKRTGLDIAEKRYPLHDAERIVSVKVMLVNSGPGTAIDALAAISCSSTNLISDPAINLGDIKPGDFPLLFEVLVGQQTSEARFDVTLTWAVTGQVERLSCQFGFKILAQNADIDWDCLRTKQPYSIEVAEGVDFVGRSGKVEAISARYARERMGSSFITGQKRVGKTSLAKAVAARVIALIPDVEVLYLEYGQYSNMDPVETVKNLGLELAEFMCRFIPDPTRLASLSFQGSLSALSKLAEELVALAPKRRFIFILDEFDEIDPALYRFGPLAEAFFSNLRTLSAKRNVAFLLVGGEKMPFVMSAQGDQLNKFVSERLDYFNLANEWENFVELIRRPVTPDLHWSDLAVKMVFDLTHGHPYYTKLVCASVYSNAVNERDTEITESDVKFCTKRLVSELDSNSFAHLWKDGISASDQQQAEVLELNRRRVLCACARTLIDGQPLTIEKITANKAGLQINPAHIHTTLMDFVRRGILAEKDGGYSIVIPLFGSWLAEVGTSRLMADALAEEYESKEQEIEESSRINSIEIVELTKKWKTYRGQQVGDEAVRAWLDQVRTNQERRLLFKLLTHLRFVNHIEIREKVSLAHGMLGQFLPTFYQEKKTDRRRDILITWVDGAGKSGNTFAGLYAEENRISTTCIVAPESISKWLDSNQSAPPAAIVVVDDFIGTGESLSTNMKAFVGGLDGRLRRLNVKLLVVAVMATAKGEKVARDRVAKLDCDAELRVVEVLSNKHYAFAEDSAIWTTTDERGRAFELCQRLGSRIHKQNPLGFGDQGLLLVFQDTCPNNSLPIIHGRSGGTEPWQPLFERPKN